MYEPQYVQKQYIDWPSWFQDMIFMFRFQELAKHGVDEIVLLSLSSAFLFTFSFFLIRQLVSMTKVLTYTLEEKLVHLV